MTTTPPTDTHEGPKLGRNQIQTFVLALDKALRAQRLYGGRESGFVAKLLDNLERELSELLAQGAVRLGVGSVGFTHEGRPLFTTAVDDIQLPWAFRLFCDGIREISFEQTMRWGELLDFLDILSTNPRMSEEDLVTMLWERDFDGIRYYAADTFAAGLEVDENGELVISAKKNLESDQGEQLEEFALSPDDIRLLSGEDHLAWLQRTRAPGRSGGAHAFQTARLKSSLQDVADLPRFMDLALEVVTRSRWTEGAGLALLTDQLDAHISRRDIEGFHLSPRWRPSLHDGQQGARAPSAPVHGAHAGGSRRDHGRCPRWPVGLRRDGCLQGAAGGPALLPLPGGPRERPDRCGRRSHPVVRRAPGLQ
jgi:hypothetical protein